MWRSLSQNDSLLSHSYHMKKMQGAMMSIVIGVDPGSRITGYGVIAWEKNTLRHVAHGQIRTKSEDLSDKLLEIFDGLSQVIAEFNPTVASIEQVFTCHNHQSALKLGQARGSAMTALAKAGLAVNEYSAKQVKRAVVGYGGADKAQVQHMIRALLRLTKTPPADAADALAIAICHCHSAVAWA
jgi:crossover junction endodeoxyribonuclease RuvC